MLYHVTIGSRTIAVELDGSSVLIDDEPAGSVEMVSAPGTPVMHLLLDGKSIAVIANRDETAWNLHVDGWPVRAEVIDERTRAIRAMTGRTATPQGPKPVRAPMPGLIVSSSVNVGDRVRAGQGVIVMEAMKMANELKAEADGVVARVLVEPGQAVERGTVLVEFEVTSS